MTSATDGPFDDCHVVRRYILDALKQMCIECRILRLHGTNDSMLETSLVVTCEVVVDDHGLVSDNTI